MERKELIKKFGQYKQQAENNWNLTLGLLYGIVLGILGNFIVTYSYPLLEVFLDLSSRIVIVIFFVVFLLLIARNLLKKLNETSRDISKFSENIDLLQELEERDKTT